MTNNYNESAAEVANAMDAVYVKKEDLPDFGYLDSDLKLHLVKIGSVTLTASDNEIGVGETVTLTATVKDKDNNNISDAPVKIYKDNVLVDTVYSNNNGVATYNETGVSGTYTFKASIGGKNSSNVNITVISLYDITIHLRKNGTYLNTPRYEVTVNKITKTNNSNHSIIFNDIPAGQYIGTILNATNGMNMSFNITVDENHTDFIIETYI